MTPSLHEYFGYMNERKLLGHSEPQIIILGCSQLFIKATDFFKRAPWYQQSAPVQPILDRNPITKVFRQHALQTHWNCIVRDICEDGIVTVDNDVVSANSGQGIHFLLHFVRRVQIIVTEP